MTHNPPSGKTESVGIVELAARLRVAASQDKCVCGENAGHVGWLVCVLSEEPTP